MSPHVNETTDFFKGDITKAKEVHLRYELPYFKALEEFFFQQGLVLS